MPRYLSLQDCLTGPDPTVQAASDDSTNSPLALFGFHGYRRIGFPSTRYPKFKNNFAPHLQRFSSIYIGNHLPSAVRRSIMGLGTITASEFR